MKVRCTMVKHNGKRVTREMSLPLGDQIEVPVWKDLAQAPKGKARARYMNRYNLSFLVIDAPTGKVARAVYFQVN